MAKRIKVPLTPTREDSEPELQVVRNKDVVAAREEASRIASSRERARLRELQKEKSKGKKPEDKKRRKAQKAERSREERKEMKGNGASKKSRKERR